MKRRWLHEHEMYWGRHRLKILLQHSLRRSNRRNPHYLRSVEKDSKAKRRQNWFHTLGKFERALPPGGLRDLMNL